MSPSYQRHSHAEENRVRWEIQSESPRRVFDEKDESAIAKVQQPRRRVVDERVCREDGNIFRRVLASLITTNIFVPV